MDVNMNASAPLAQRASDTMGLTVLRKAMDMESRSAMALLDAIPQAARNSVNLPPNLGQNVNTTA